MSTQPKRVLFPGSFDPFTKGHANMVERGLELFDHVIIAVGYNENKPGWIPVQERVSALKALYANEPRVTVESYSCLTVDFARQCGAKAILRALYSTQLADENMEGKCPKWSPLFSLPTLIC